MRKLNSRGRFLPKVLACFLSVVLAMGVMGPGVAVAYADAGGAALKALSLKVVPQYVGYDVYVGETAVTVSNANDILGDGTASFDESTRTLTLNGATITSAHDYGETASIYATGVNLTIDLKGNNSLSEAQKGIVVAGGTLEIKSSSGNGSLSAVATDCGIEVSKSVTISSGTVTTTGGSCGLKAGGSSWVYVEGGSLTAEGARGIEAAGNVSITGGSVKAVSTSTGKTDAAIYAYNSIQISGGTVEAKGGRHGLYASGGNISVSEKAISVTVPSSTYAAVYSYGTITIDTALTLVTPVDGVASSNAHNNYLYESDGSTLAKVVTIKTAPKNYAVYENGTLTFKFDYPEVGAYTGFDTAVYTKHQDVPWDDTDHQRITKVVFDESVDGNLKPKSTAFWFFYCSNLTSVEGLRYVDTSEMTSMDRMFWLCGKLESLMGMSAWDTSQVQNMNQLFYQCTSLTSADCFNWSTSSVTNMHGMFEQTAFTEFEFGNNWSTESVEDMASMFSSCTNITSLDLSTFDTANAVQMQNMFFGCSKLASITFGSSFTTANAKQLWGMFAGCSALTTLELLGFDTRNAEYMDGMFDVSNWRSGLFSLRSITFGENFRFNGKGIDEPGRCAKLPVVKTEIALDDMSVGTGLTGKWRKVDDGDLLMPAAVQELTGEELAGTWNVVEGQGITLQAGEGGTASGSPLSGLEGDKVTLTATPDAGYKFVGWEFTGSEGVSDGYGSLSSDTANPVEYTFGTEYGSVTATFAKNAYTIGKLSATSFTYNGKKQVPTVTVKDGATTLTAGKHYSVSYAKGSTAMASPTAAGTYTVYVTGKGDYSGMAKAKAGTFTIKQADIAKAKLTLKSAKFTYNTKVQRPTITKVGSIAFASADYTVKYSNANSKNAGSYTVWVVGKNNCKGTSAKATYKIAKAAATASAKAASVTLKYANTSKKAQVVANLKVPAGQGKVTYKNASTNVTAKKFTVNAKTGKVTVPKGTKRGTYATKVKVTTNGGANYNKGTKTVTFTIKVV